MKYLITFIILSIASIETASSQVRAKVGDSVVVYRFNGVCPGEYSRPFSLTKSKTGQFGFTDIYDTTIYNFGFYFKPTAKGIYKDTIEATYWCVDMQNDYMTGATYILEATAVDSLTGVHLESDTVSYLTVVNQQNQKPHVFFSCRRNEKVIIEVFDILGNTKKTLVNETMNIGSYRYMLDFPSGVYFARLQTKNGISSVKVYIP